MPPARKRQGANTAKSVVNRDAKISKLVETTASAAGDSSETAVSKLVKLKNDSTSSKESSDESTNDLRSTDTKSSYFKEGDGDLTDEDSSSSDRLPASFFEQSCEDLAKALLGKLLVRKHNGHRLAGRIIETESYLGKRDKAAHSYKGRTERNAAMFMDPGTAYVYNIYGMYCCMNISSQGEGEAVLIRSLEPVEGKEIMQEFRAKSQKSPGSKAVKERDLCNGPSKLTQALKIDKASVNKVDMRTSEEIWLERGDPVPASKMVISKRINIAYAEEWTDKPLRFYELGNICVCVKDKEEEKKMKTAT